jgi:hypothetical protein
MRLPVIAGVVSTILFAVSTLPMVVKAQRTRDLGSYSLGALVLANAGNVVHAVYVFDLPMGPVWALHGMYLVTTGLMLVWFLRYVPRHAQPQVTRTDHPPTLVTPTR